MRLEKYPLCTIALLGTGASLYMTTTLIADTFKGALAVVVIVAVVMQGYQYILTTQRVKTDAHWLLTIALYILSIGATYAYTVKGVQAERAAYTAPTTTLIDQKIQREHARRDRIQAKIDNYYKLDRITKATPFEIQLADTSVIDALELSRSNTLTASVSPPFLHLTAPENVVLSAILFFAVLFELVVGLALHSAAQLFHTDEPAKVPIKNAPKQTKKQKNTETVLPTNPPKVEKTLKNKAFPAEKPTLSIVARPGTDYGEYTPVMQDILALPEGAEVSLKTVREKHGLTERESRKVRDLAATDGLIIKNNQKWHRATHTHLKKGS